MKRKTLKQTIGSAIILSHFGIMLWVFWLGRDYLKVKQMVDLMTSVAPLLGFAIIVVAKSFVTEKGAPTDEAEASYGLIFMSAIAVVVYMLGAYGALLSFPQHIAAVEDLRTVLLTVEAIFGVYLGLVIDTLFYPKQGS